LCHQQSFFLAGEFALRARTLLIAQRPLQIALTLAVVIGRTTGVAQAQTAVVGEKAMPARIVEVVPAAPPGWFWAPDIGFGIAVHGSGLKVIKFEG
jgi:hypothetical protein